MTTQQLITQIQTAFAQVPHCGNHNITNSYDDTETIALKNEFKDKTNWQNLDSTFLDQAPDGFSSALSFFTKEAFRFYLPAYLLADIRQQLQCVDVVFHLTHGLTNSAKYNELKIHNQPKTTWYESTKNKFAIFLPPEKQAITAYLQYKKLYAEFESDKQDIDEALHNYWN